MSTAAVVIAVLGAWLGAGLAAGVLVGRAIHCRDQQTPRDDPGPRTFGIFTPPWTVAEERAA